MLGNKKVKRLVNVLGMVNHDPSFNDQSKAINGFSRLIIEAFGKRGRHVRGAVGITSLTRGQAKEIEIIVEVED